MLNLMPLAFAAANSIFILRNARAGIAMYFALALISPHAHFGAVTVSYEILAFPTVLLVLLTSSSKVGLRRLHFLLLGYLALIVTSSFLSIATDGTSMEWFRLISMIRYVVLVVMADSFLDRKTVGKVLLFVVVVNLFASGVQMLVPESVGSFHKMYGKSSQVVLSGFVELGYISRAVGTFGSPVNLAAFCLVVLSIFFARFLNNDRGPATVVGILSSLVTGILSITKLFILGVPAIIVLVTAFHLILKRNRSFSIRPVRLILGSVIIGISFFLASSVIDVLDARGFTIYRYLGYLNSPTDAFETRYSHSTGILSDTMSLIADNVLMGMGNTKVGNEFLGDSAFVVVLHDVGVIGMLLMGVVVGLVLIPAFRRRDTEGLASYSCLLLSGFALPSFFSLVGALIISYACAGQLSGRGKQ